LGTTVSATIRELNRRLHYPVGGKPWDVFHFIGHGGFDSKRGEGFIVIQEEGGASGRELYADSLRDLLTGPHEPQLVVLNSCSGATSEPGDLFSSTAARLVLGRIPAVVAMQFPISDEMAIKFSKLFYSYLSDGYGVRTALILTRVELRNNGFDEWVSPVLYMRTPDEPFFPNDEDG
jgi:CHAT domain-containing protein